LVGTTQGNTYTLERLLHDGRHGTLFEAKQIRLGYRCAVRLLSIDPGQRKPLLAVLSQQAQLHHPSLIAPIDTMLLADDRLLLATPLLTGQDLAQRVAGQGKLSLAEGLAVLRAATGALHALHQRGLCHGAVTARNLFVASFDDVAVDGAMGGGQGNQRVCLLDGGLYLASGENASAADDQAALAKLLDETVSDVPPALKAVLTQAINPSPGQRFSSMQAMWRAAEASQGNKAVGAQPTALVGVLRMPSVASPGSRWPLLAVAGAFLILAAVVGVVGLGRSPAVPEPARVVAKSVGESEQVTIQLELSPDHAQVMVNGKVMKNPLALLRSTEPVPLTIAADGYLPSTSKIVPDRDRSVHISLARAVPTEEAGDSTKKRGKSRSKK
jgi:hypothetical protein